MTTKHPKESKSIVMLISSTDKVGVSVHCLALAEGLKENGYNILAITFSEGWFTRELDKKLIERKTIPCNLDLYSSIRSSASLTKLLLMLPPSLIMINGRLPLILSGPSLLITKHRFVTTVHQFLSHAHDLKGAIEKFLLKRQDLVICVSEALRKEVPKSSKDNITIENFLSRSPKVTTFCPRKKHTQIYCIGRLSREKGQDILINALPTLRSYNIDYQCFFIGSGPEEQALKKTCRKLQLDNQVTFLGTIENTHYHMAQADILVVPSRQESFGLVVLEAWNAGPLVIASDTKGLGDLVEDRTTGLTFKNGASSDLALKIKEALDHPRLVAEIKKKAKTKLLENYTFEKGIARYMDLLDSFPKTEHEQ